MATPMITNLKKVTLLDTKMVDPTLYRKFMGSLMYMVNTRQDICFVVNTFSSVELTKENWVVENHVLRYSMGIVEYNIRYIQDGELKF